MMFALSFLLLTALVTTVVLVVIRPRASDRSVQARLASVRIPKSPGSKAGNKGEDLLKVTTLSHWKTLNKLLVEFPLFLKLDRLRTAAAVSRDVGDVVVCSLVLLVIGTGLSAFACPKLWLAPILGITFGSLPVVLLYCLRSKRVNAFNAGLPAAIDIMARSIRVGQSLSAAVETVASQSARPLSSEFAEIVKRQGLGLPFREALLQLAERVPSSDLQFLVTAMLVQKETGGNLVQTLERSAEVIRERVKIQGDVRTRTAQGRLTGWILTALPVVLLIVLNIVNPEYSRVLFVEPLGRKLLIGAAIMLFLGGISIRKIVRIEV